MLPTNIFLCQLFAVLFKESKHLLSWEGKVACETRELTTKGRVAEAVLHLPTNLHLVNLHFYKEKSLGCHPAAQCRANCLHLPLFLPASEALRSYLFIFSHAARPAHCHSAHPFFPKRKDAVEVLGDRDFPHTSRLLRKPC